MTDWVLEYVLIKWFPICTVPPDVDLRPFRHPAQFASDVTSIKSWGAWKSNFHTSLGFPFRNLPILFNISHARCVGLAILRHTSLVLYCISGRSGWR